MGGDRKEKKKNDQKETNFENLNKSQEIKEGQNIIFTKANRRDK